MELLLHFLYQGGAMLLGDPDVTRLIMTGVTMGVGYTLNKFLGKYVAAADRATAQQAIVAGVQQTMPIAKEYLDRTTHLSPAGQRSSEEEQQLRDIAIAKATDVAKQTGVNLQKVLAGPLMHATLEHAVDVVRGKIAPVPTLTPGVKTLLPLVLCAVALGSGCATTGGQLPDGWGLETVTGVVQVSDHVTEYLSQPGHEPSVIATAVSDARDLYRALRNSGADKEEASQKTAIHILAHYREAMGTLRDQSFGDYCREKLQLPATVNDTSIVIGIIYFAVR